MALFAALAYAITRTGRSSGGIALEQNSLATALSNQCNADVQAAEYRLEIDDNCTPAEISYQLPDGSNANPLAPADGSCSVFDPRGMNVPPCGSYLAETCDITTLAAGTTCPGGTTVYVGIDNGSRLYTTLTDQGSTSWNNGGTTWTTTGASSTSDGATNTATLVALVDAGSPYNAALMCSSLGAPWYLPSVNELNTLYLNMNTGVLAGTFNTTDVYQAGMYWTSTENTGGPGNAYAEGQYFMPAASGWTGVYSKNMSTHVRCVRR